MVLFFLLDGGYMYMYSCELIKTCKLVMRQNFYTTDDTATENRLVWLFSFTEVTNNTDSL